MSALGPDENGAHLEQLCAQLHAEAEFARGRAELLRMLSGAEAQPGRENHEGDRACDASDPGSSSPLSLTEWPL